MNTRLVERLDDRLRQIERDGRWKDYCVFTSGPGARIRTADGHDLRLFTSNDYLGLASDRRVIAAAEMAARRYGGGMASARFVCGTTDLHRTLEIEIAGLCATEAALTFTSGWTANLALLSTLPEPGDLIVSDELNHASLIDGARLAPRGVDRVVVPHGNLKAFERALAEWRGTGIAYLVTDGVFSMEGTAARLDELVSIARQHGAVLIVDDAHGLGVVGPTGRGVGEQLKVLGQIDIITGSLGKALGGIAGGFIAGPKILMGVMEQLARAFLFTTAITPAAAAASLEAIRILRAEPAMVSALRGNVVQFVEALVRAGFNRPHTDSAIVPLVLGDSAPMRAFAETLRQQGIYASCFAFPIVPEGMARVRFQVSLAHSDDDFVACAAACIKAAGR